MPHDDPADPIRFQARLPKEEHDAMAALADLAGCGYNDVVVDCVAAIWRMVQAEHEEEITIPEIVVRARAIQAHRRRPKSITYLRAAQEEDCALVAETPHSPIVAQKRRAGGK